MAYREAQHLQTCRIELQSGNGPASIHFVAAQASVHVCYTCTRPAAQLSFPQGQQIYLQLSMFDYGAQGQ